MTTQHCPTCEFHMTAVYYKGLIDHWYCGYCQLRRWIAV